MNAFGVVIVLAAVAVFGAACWRAGLERGICECEDKLATAHRLQAVALADAKREGRAEIGREMFGELGRHWAENWGNPLGLKSAPEVEIDLRDNERES